MPLTAWENTVISRLQTPTHSYLARSRSAMSLSGEAGNCLNKKGISNFYKTIIIIMGQKVKTVRCKQFLEEKSAL